jgi:hypothetical protein
MVRLRWLAALLLVLFLLGLAVRMNTETIGDREAVCDELRGLREQVVAKNGDDVALKKMIARLHGRWSFAATHAAVELGELSDLGESAVPDLIWALNCGNEFVEREAATAIGRIGPFASAAIPALIKKLSCETRDAGWFSAESLGKIGPAARVALPALERAAASTNMLMARDAQKAYCRIKYGTHEEILPKIQLLKSRVLANDQREESLKSLDEWIQTDDKFAVINAVQALGELRELAAPNVDSLIFAVNWVEPGVEMAALEALKQIGPAARKAIPVLRKKIASEPRSQDRVMKGGERDDFDDIPYPQRNVLVAARNLLEELESAE